MRLIGFLICFAIALSCVGASIACNFLFLTSFAATPEEWWVYTAVSVAVDAFKCMLPLWIAAAISTKQRGWAAIMTVIFVLCLALSFTSAVGFASRSRNVSAGSKEAVNTTYTQTDKELSALLAERNALGDVRLVADIEGDLESAKLEPRFRSTNGCTPKDVTAPESRVLCNRIAALNAEKGRAEKYAELSTQISTKQTRLTTLREQGAGLEADPQAKLLSRIMSVVVTVSVGDVQGSVALIIAVLVELLAAFGVSIVLTFMSPWGAPAVEILPETTFRSDPDVIRTSGAHPQPGTTVISLPPPGKAVARGRRVRL